MINLGKVALAGMFCMVFSAMPVRAEETENQTAAALSTTGTAVADPLLSDASILRDPVTMGNFAMPVVVSPSDRNPYIDARNRLVRIFPLHWAAIQDQVAVIDILIESGRQVDDRDGEGRTPLMLASAFGNVSAVNALLAHGADINARDAADGETAMHVSARFGRIDVARTLLGHGASVNVQTTKTGRFPLHFAAGFGHAAMIEFLIEASGDPNAQDYEGVSPIFYASRRNRPVIVELLRNYGGQFGGLHEAINADDIGRVLSLLWADADVDEPNLAGPPIHFAASKGSLAIVRILADRGARLKSHAGNSGSTPMHVAAMTNRPEIIEFLASRGADIEALDGEGRTPLIVAASFGSAKSVEKLLNLGAYNRAMDTIYKHTALHVAAKCGYGDIVRLLIASGVDADEISPATGMTALHFASQKDQVETARILLDNGADMNIRDRNGNTPATIFRVGPHVLAMLDRLSASRKPKSAGEQGSE